jgi:outer membrane protein TolC
VTALAVAGLPLQPISAQLDSRLPGSAPLPTEIPTMMMPPVPTVAPGYRAPLAGPTGTHIIGVTQQPFVAISLQDAIAMSLLGNTNLAISASNFRIAHYNIVQAKGAYDVSLHLQPQSNYSVNPPQNFLAAGPGEEASYGPSSAPIYTTGPGNIIQHQSATGYGLSGQTETRTIRSISRRSISQSINRCSKISA